MPSSYEIKGKVTKEEVVPLNKAEHFEAIKNWWGLYYDDDDFPEECLPDTGAVAMFKGKPAAAAFVYKTNAKMAMIHLPVADPAIGSGMRVHFLRQAVKEAVRMAKQWLDGEGFIWCLTDHAVVGRVYAENGMVCSGEGDVFYLQVGDQCHNFLD